MKLEFDSQKARENESQLKVEVVNLIKKSNIKDILRSKELFTIVCTMIYELILQCAIVSTVQKKQSFRIANSFVKIDPGLKSYATSSESVHRIKEMQVDISSGVSVGIIWDVKNLLANGKLTFGAYISIWNKSN